MKAIIIVLLSICAIGCTGTRAMSQESRSPVSSTKSTPSNTSTSRETFAPKLFHKPGISLADMQAYHPYGYRFRSTPPPLGDRFFTGIAATAPKPYGSQSVVQIHQTHIKGWDYTDQNRAERRRNRRH